jgi:beta-phosphoglucomutase-like phosphatase (HAD superfamily)
VDSPNPEAPGPASLDLAAIVFDFDGVLANSEPLHERAYKAVLADLGVTFTHERYYAEYLGFDDVGVFEAVSKDFGLSLSEQDIRSLIAVKSDALASLIDEAGVLFPGARACVERCAAAVPLAIASGALRREIELVLTRTGLSRYFQCVVGAEDTPRSKPAPDPYARAVARLGVDPARTAAIEDSRWGMESAAAAGLKVVAVTTTYAAADLGGADLIVSSLDEIAPDRLDAIIRQGRRHP